MSTRKFGIRRVMTPNQIVAYNVAKARALRGWTQEQAAEALAPYLGARLSEASFSALERSAWKVEPHQAVLRRRPARAVPRVRPPHRVLLHPAAASLRRRPLRPRRRHQGTRPHRAARRHPRHTRQPRATGKHELLAYSASQAPEPRSKREKPSVSPNDLPHRLEPIGTLRAKALLRQAFGELDDAGEVLERLAEALRLLDDTASHVTADETSRNDTGSTPARARKSAAKR